MGYTVPGHNPWTWPLDTTPGHDPRTRPPDTTPGHDPWTRPLDTTPGHDPWTRPPDTTPGHGPWESYLDQTPRRRRRCRGSRSPGEGSLRRTPPGCHCEQTAAAASSHGRTHAPTNTRHWRADCRQSMTNHHHLSQPLPPLKVSNTPPHAYSPPP